jgi:hypothetical protein
MEGRRVNVEIKVPDGLVARMQSFLNGARSPLNVLRVMGEAVKEKTREHLAGLAGSRHATAQRLGGTPTGHLEEAARAVEDAPLTVDAQSAAFVINHPGISRAFHDVTIAMKDKRLAIPVNGIAYGHSPREFAQVQFVHRGEEIRQDIAAFILCREVTQKQDRSLLPSNAEWKGAAIAAAEELLRSS